MLPNSYLHLLIAGQTIICEYQDSLWYAANTPDYQEYMQDFTIGHDKTARRSIG